MIEGPDRYVQSNPTVEDRGVVVARESGIFQIFADLTKAGVL